MHEPLRIAIANDYEIVVAGVAEVLSRFPERVRVVELAAGQGVSADVDIVLYDSFAQEHDQRRSVAELVACGDARVVVFSWNVHEGPVADAMAAGASGYLSKRLGGDELVEGLERIARGERPTPVASASDDGAVDDLDLPTLGRWPGDELGLSARESEVLALICQGLTNDEITRRAYLSINTVKTYIRSLYRKIGVDSRTQAVLWGLGHGFAPDEARMRLDPA